MFVFYSLSHLVLEFIPIFLNFFYLNISPYQQKYKSALQVISVGELSSFDAVGLAFFCAQIFGKKY